MTQEELRALEAVAMNIVHQIGDALYEALPPEIAHKYFVTARQATNDKAIDFAQSLIQSLITDAVGKALVGHHVLEHPKQPIGDCNIMTTGLELTPTKSQRSDGLASGTAGHSPEPNQPSESSASTQRKGGLR